MIDRRSTSSMMIAAAVLAASCGRGGAPAGEGPKAGAPAAPAPVPTAPVPTAPAPAPVPTAPAPAPVARAGLAVKVEGVYELPAATSAAPLPAALAHVVFVAADGATRVGTTTSFADAQAVNGVAAIAAAVRGEAPWGQGIDRQQAIEAARNAGIIGATGEEVFGDGLGPSGGAGEGTIGLGRYGTIGGGRGAVGVGFGVDRGIELATAPLDASAARTVLVVDRTAPADTVARIVDELPGPVALAVDRGAAGAGVLSVTVATAPLDAPGDPQAIAGTATYAELLALVDGKVAGGAAALRLQVGTPARGGMRGRSATIPSVRIGAATSSGGLDKAIIRRYVKRSFPKIKYCYEKQLLSAPGLEGTVTARFTIGATGAVESSEASGVDPDVASCIAGVIKGIEFPRPRGGGTVQVTYPFVLRPGA